MAKTKEIRAIVGKYEQGGQEKNRYATVGALFEGEKGMVAKLDLIPTNPDWDGTLFFNEPYEQQKKQFDEGMAQAKQVLNPDADKGDINDDIPF